jgi:hypothetical protein
MRFSRSIRYASIAGLAFSVAPAFFSASANAADMKDVSYSIEPIVGYELQKKESPTRTKAVFTYGARVIAGYKILSAEGEYTQGNSDEYFGDTGTRIEEKTEKARLGLRSTYSLGDFFDWHLRGGAEGQRRHTRRTIGGVATENDSPAQVFPYVGTGVSLNFAQNLALNASVVATVKDLNDLSKTEYSTSLGLRIGFNAK